MKPTRLVNRRRAGYDTYIGRPGPWGNPFREGRDGTRAEVIKKYEIWLRAQLKRPTFATAFDALRGQTLGCHCKPKACHGDVMLKVLEERAAGAQEKK